jgi:hypothetical protein
MHDAANRGLYPDRAFRKVEEYLPDPLARAKHVLFRIQGKGEPPGADLQDAFLQAKTGQSRVLKESLQRLLFGQPSSE